MKFYRYNEDNENGIFKCLFVDIGKKYRWLLVLSDRVWYTKGVRRRIPIWIDKENPRGFSLFCFKLAIRFGRRKYNESNREEVK